MFSSSRRATGLILVMAFALQAALVFFVSQVLAAPAKVTIWDHFIHDKKYTTKMYKDFNKKNKDVQIEYTSQVFNVMQQVLPLAFQTGEAPDLFFGSPRPGATLEELVEEGYVQALEDIAPSEAALRAWKARFPASKQPFVEGLNVVKGKTYMFPRIDMNSEALRFMFINTRLFKEAGLDPTPPRTVSELRRAASAITTKGQKRYYGAIIPLQQPYGSIDVSMLWTIAVAAGHPSIYGFDYRTGRYDYTNQGLRTAIQVWLDMKDDGSIMPGYLSMSDEEAKRYVANDKVGIIFGGWWNPSNFLAYNPKAEFDVGLGPTGDDGVRRGYITVGPAAAQQSYYISKKAKNPAAVWNVVEFLTSKEFQEGYVRGGYGISIFPEFNKPEHFTTPGMAKIAQWGVTATRVEPTVPKDARTARDRYADWSPPYLQDHIVGMFLGKEQMSTVLPAYEKRANEVLDKAIKTAQAAGLKVTRQDFVFPDWDPTKDYVPSGKK
ncbi:MAG: extracellular solute-binding protein [Firmicutes bacterium]|nr:extracellular solute-binding protein [Bacillota bacterium]